MSPKRGSKASEGHQTFFQTSRPEGRYDTIALQRIWRQVGDSFAHYLEAADDRRFWQTVVPWLLADAASESESYGGKGPILAQIGACSHWIRPHQSQISIAGGFAAPFGYGNDAQGYSFRSLPELDGSLVFRLDSRSGVWEQTKGRPGRRPLVLRASLPARTARHGKAAIHTIWTPGSPTSPKNKVLHLYFFRRQDESWSLEGEIYEQEE